jgi:RNA polymerase sigma-70 factor (ECF subfamily)
MTTSPTPPNSSSHLPADSESRDPDEDPSGSLLLIRKAQEGDAQAYEELFERYYPRVHRIVRRQMGNQARIDGDSMDVLQEAMIQAIRAFDRFEVRSQPALIAWFARIVKNRLRDDHRRRHAAKRDAGVEKVLHHISRAYQTGSLRYEALDEGPLPEDQLVRKEELGGLQQALLKIEPIQRDLILLRKREELPWSEIAERLNFPSADAARMAYGRAKLDLRRAMEAFE